MPNTEPAATSNRALVLLGFWRGFRCDELTRLQVEQVRGKDLFYFRPAARPTEAARPRVQRVRPALHPPGRPVCLRAHRGCATQPAMPCEMSHWTDKKDVQHF